jgi:hypothetical protein
LSKTSLKPGFIAGELYCYVIFIQRLEIGKRAISSSTLQTCFVEQDADPAKKANEHTRYPAKTAL